ncbi:MAG TPA: phosphomethylpyrimidine synthase ThiC, partial [Desulfobacterales bacterium]|nr:phosphomethylpyrimidine synthase ThiC [Desulfobacterales bacterium]
MTQIDAARSNQITDAMHQVAQKEGLTAEKVREKVAAGMVVIPKNRNRNCQACGIGQGLKTKVNANIGTSPSHCDLKEELAKLDTAVAAGADAVMDLSTGGNLDRILQTILKRSSVIVGTVPIYKVVSKLMAKNKTSVEMTADDLMEEIEMQAMAGVDFITVHCGITRQSLSALKGCDRIMGMVSRGGSFMAEWIIANKKENPLYAQYDRLLEICRQHDVTLSLGDGLRPGAIHDAEDRAQISELLILGELARRARKAGVQVMIEGPGHVPLGRIPGDVQLQKRLCDNAPYYVLGPLPTDIAPGYDHLVGAIGGAVAAASGVDFLCYLTPAEHLHLPTIQDVHDGVMATRIAAHIGDLEKGLPGAANWDRNMSLARRKFDWDTMYSQAIDPQLARKRRMQTEDHHRDVCTMCGDL